jgi:hypothetical protein
VVVVLEDVVAVVEKDWPLISMAEAGGPLLISLPPRRRHP